MIDVLTGLPNIVGMLDWIKTTSCCPTSSPFSLAAYQLTALWQVNRSEGMAAGDELLRGSARVLLEQNPGRVFRNGGDKFVVFLEGADIEANAQAAERLSAAIQTVYPAAGLALPRTAVIHFTDEKDRTPGNVLACLFFALMDRFHENANGALAEFNSGEIRASAEYPWMMIDLANQLMSIGNTANRNMYLAQTDSVSKLPNMRAAMTELETDLEIAKLQEETLAVLLIDGDNLRRFNSVSYESGDEAIRLMAAALRQQLRETDFLARFRSGDEFLVLLRNTPLERAKAIAERLRDGVERASRSWLFPTTVSIGIAIYPRHGMTVQDLLHKAEDGLDAAKENGKNQAVMSEFVGA